MLFRKAVKDDSAFIAESLKAILSLHAKGREDIFRSSGAKYTAEDIVNMLSDTDTHIFVAEENGVLYGYAICYIVIKKDDPVFKDRAVFYLDDLYVLPETRGKGIGHKFMDFLFGYAKECGCRSFELNVWEFDGSATGFYKKCGMTTQKRTMEKKL